MKKIVGILIAIIVAAPVLVLGVNEVRGSGIAYSNLKEIKATRSLIQEYIDEEYESAFQKIDTENNKDKTNAYDEFVNFRKKMDQKGIVIKSYRFSSIARDDDYGYTIVYKIELTYNDKSYKNVSIELRGNSKKYILWTFGCENHAEEKIIDVLQELF